MMRLRMLLPAALLGLLLALGAFSVGCGGGEDDNGDDEPTATAAAEATDEGEGEPTDEPAEPSGDLEEYFQELDAAEDKLRSGQQQSDESFAALNDSSPPDDIIAVFEEGIDIVDEFVADLQALDPPPEVEVAHEETVAAFQAVSGILAEAIDAVEGGGTFADAQDLLSSPEANNASVALDALCEALQQIATDNGIDVDLSCQN